MATTLEEIKATIQTQWEASAQHKQMDWQNLENTIRKILKEVKNKSLHDYDAINLIDETLAAFTLRGHEL